MASSSKSLRLPIDISEAADIRARQLGYKNWTAYITGLIRYDLMVQGDHTITLPISHARPEDQDKLDADLLDRCRSGKAMRGQWLEKAIQRIADHHAEEVARQLGEKLTE